MLLGGGQQCPEPGAMLEHQLLATPCFSSALPIPPREQHSQKDFFPHPKPG